MALRNPVQMIRQFLEGPLTRPVLMRWRLQQYHSNEGFGSHFGLFESFEAARAWLPRSAEYDQAALATEFVRTRTKRIFAYDYPMMWWLERAFRSGATSVLDIGGAVGVHYHAYRRYMEMPSSLTWRIVEVPAMVASGRELATWNGVSVLSFTDNLPQALADADAEVWISAGAIHCLEDGRPNHLLQRCTTRPRHILLNKLPLYEGDDFVTTHHLGEGAYIPMYVYNRMKFIQDIEALGYTLRDQWSVHERSLYLPGYPERSFSSFTGLYFEDESAPPRDRR